MIQSNKRKIFNDPVYGFITIPGELIFDIIEHPYFQRLRRIKQLGLTHLVYPGALHTRFHHALGAMYLMSQAISILKSKGHTITAEESDGALIAILLHDIGHGPFSHALENSIVSDLSHEDISEIFMDKLNSHFEGKISLALEIFRNTYTKKFIHQLLASQLDMDRLDYLKRDSFFTGVSEGVINSDRIIKMLNVVDDQLVAEVKGIYSIEKFIIARRFMYWQVYLHKTVIAAEYMLLKILQRAKNLKEKGEDIFSTPVLEFFLKGRYNRNDFLKDPSLIDNFAKLDDFDIFTSIKVWSGHSDKVLSTLCSRMVNRHLSRVIISENEFPQKDIDLIREKTKKRYNLEDSEIEYFVYSYPLMNNAYDPQHDKINILYKNGQVVDIAEASDQLNICALAKTDIKYFLSYPKSIESELSV